MSGDISQWLHSAGEQSVGQHCAAPAPFSLTHHNLGSEDQEGKHDDARDHRLPYLALPHQHQQQPACLVAASRRRKTAWAAADEIYELSDDDDDVGSGSHAEYSEDWEGCSQITE